MTHVIAEIIHGGTYQYDPLGTQVVRAVGICGGRPTYTYTRIEMAGTRERLVAGESLDAMVAGYRGRVSREAILEAIQIVTAGCLKALSLLAPA